MQPTRGLDVGAIDYVHSRLIEARNQGMAVLLISTDSMKLWRSVTGSRSCARAVSVGTLARADATMDGIGRLMLGSTSELQQAAA